MPSSGIRDATVAVILGTGMVFATAVRAADDGRSSVAAPVYDASGDWMLHVSGLKLRSGECPLADDGGYDEHAHIEQNGRFFIITVGEGMSERGAIDGATYRHQGAERGTDITGMPFSVTSKSTLELTSSVAAVGSTRITIDFQDGSQCVLDFQFSGEREQG